MANNETFVPNDVRGCSYFFSFNAAKGFLDSNRLLSVIRAHEAQSEGFKMHRAHPVNHFPTVSSKLREMQFHPGYYNFLCTELLRCL